MRKVLCAMLTRACKTDGAVPIKARIDRLAEEANVSTKTVQRAVQAFRELGWLALHDESGRSPYGVFCARLYHFTYAFCDLVRLPNAATAAKNASSKNHPSEMQMEAEETKLSDGAVYVDLTFKKDQQEISLKKNKGNPVDLPPELQDAAAEFNIRETGIAALRGIAHEAGHSLQTILTVARAYLLKAGVIGHRAYRYLETMASRPSSEVDYAARAQQTERISAEMAKRKEQLSMRARCRYKRFMGPGGVSVRFFDGLAEVIINGAVRTVTGPDLDQIFAKIESGWLKEIVT